MIRGLYVASTGMNVQTKRMDVISNDLANVSTTGYKKDTAVVASFPQILMQRINDRENHIPNDKTIGKFTPGARVVDTYTSFTQGSLTPSDGVVNMALQGDGFFVVNTTAGLAYTRDGSFTVNNLGEVVTKEGYQVMGQNGGLTLGEDYLLTGGEVTLSEQGILSLNGKVIDTINIVAFEDNQALAKIADNLYQGDAAQTEFTGSVALGYLEASNVNPVTAMVEMITVSRAYEANQKMVQTHDSLLGKAVNDLGNL